LCKGGEKWPTQWQLRTSCTQSRIWLCHFHPACDTAQWYSIMIATYSGTSCTTEISYSVHGSSVAQDGLLLILELYPLYGSLSLMVEISIWGDAPASNIHHHILMWKVTVYLCMCCSNLLYIYLLGLSPPRIFHCSSCNPTAWIHYSSHAYLKSRVSPTKQHTNTGGGNGVIITQAVKSEAQPTRHVSTHCTLSQSVQRRREMAHPVTTI